MYMGQQQAMTMGQPAIMQEQPLIKLDLATDTATPAAASQYYSLASGKVVGP